MASAVTTIKSVWWLPDSPNKRLPGEVTYGPTSGAEIDLFGYPHDSFDDKKLLERFTLHGVTFKTKPISLFRCLISGGEIHLPGGRSCKISSVFGVVGGHYGSADEIMFRTVRVQYKGLVDWTCITGIGVKVEENPRSLTVTYQIPTTIQLGTFGPFSARVEISGHAQPDFHSFHIEEDCTFVIESAQMQPYSAFEEYILAFQQFLCLAIQRPVRALEIVGQVDKPRQVVQERPILEEYLIIRKMTIPHWGREKLMPQDLLFSLRELAPSPAAFFETFVERQEKLRAAMDLYFSTIYNENQPPRVEFLTLAQSLEAFHRATMPGKYLDDETYKSGLRKALCEAIPAPPEIDAAFRASLENKLNYLHEFSLKKRLKDLARKHSNILQPLIGDAKEFSDSVGDLRNRLTHPGGGDTDPDKDYRKLLRLSEMMALLLEVCFLNEIGFAPDRIKEIICSRSQRAYRIHRGWV